MSTEKSIRSEAPLFTEGNPSGVAVEALSRIAALEAQLVEQRNASEALLKIKENRINELEQENARLRSDRTALTVLVDYFEHKSSVDGLTGLLRRDDFVEGVEALRRVVERTEGATSVIMMLDIDRFKKINDEMGHAAGDDALRAFSDKLRNVTRNSDLKGRIGGEEVAVFFPNATAADIRLKFLSGEGEHATLKTDYSSKDQEGEDFQSSFTVSGGIVEVKKGDNLSEILRRADALLYKAKANTGEGEDRKVGRNQILEEAA